jgi:hypothetical protein
MAVFGRATQVPEQSFVFRAQVSFFEMPLWQGCQMVYFQTKNTNFGTWDDKFGIFHGHFEFALLFWYIVRPFCIFVTALIYFFTFLFVVLRKIWQNCSLGRVVCPKVFRPPWTPPSEVCPEASTYLVGLFVKLCIGKNFFFFPFFQRKKIQNWPWQTKDCISQYFYFFAYVWQKNP